MPEQRARPPELFCVAGRTSREILDHEEFLFQQHEAGAIQLHDRGRGAEEGPPLRRWRMSYERSSCPDGAGVAVHAALATREDADGVRMWLAASCENGWGWRVAHPLERLALHRYPVIDPASGLSATRVGTAATPDEVVRIARDRRIDIPVLVLHTRDTTRSREAMEFRSATLGAVAMVVLDDATARRSAARLSPRWRIPEHGARLFLPRWWRGVPETAPEGLDASGTSGVLGELGVLDAPAVEAESSEADWKDLVRIALHAASWRASEAALPVDHDTWHALLTEPFNDERVALARGETAQWPSKRTGAGKRELGRRIRANSLAELRETADRSERTAVRLAEFVRRSTEALESSTESRRRLTKGVLRLRAERDAAQDRIDGTTVGEAQRRTAEATRIVRARAELLRARREEQARLRRQMSRLRSAERLPLDEPELSWEQVVDEAQRRSRLRLGEYVSVPTGTTSTALYRCRHVLELLDGYRRGPVAEHLRRNGISASLLGAVGSDPAVTFPIVRADPAGSAEIEWVCFGDYVRLDHGTVPPLVLHYHVDPDGVVHIGHIGRSLSRDIA